MNYNFQFLKNFITDDDDDDELLVNVDRSHINNEECGKLHKTTLKNICDVRLCTKNHSNCSHLLGHSLSLITGN